MSIRSCFLKSFNFFDESETLIYEGGGELIAVSKDFIPKHKEEATDDIREKGERG
jgi:hypothetical protein